MRVYPKVKLERKNGKIILVSIYCPEKNNFAPAVILEPNSNESKRVLCIEEALKKPYLDEKDKKELLIWLQIKKIKEKKLELLKLEKELLNLLS